MKRTIFPALAPVLAALLLLSGCAAPAFWSRLTSRSAAEAGDGLLVYRTAADLSDGGELLRAERYPLPEDGADELEVLLTLLRTPSSDPALRCALPPDVALEGWTLENGVVTLELSDAFLEGPDMDRTVAALCAALTLCQLDRVDAVTVAAGGQTLFAGLMPEDAFLDAGADDPYTRQLRLYFPDGDGRYLVSEYHSLTLDEDTSPERYVVEELLRGPNNGELNAALPAGTRLLSCVTEGGLCTVDLTGEFLSGRPDTPLGERLVLYALADSLTALSGVDGVRLLVEGQPVDRYVVRSLAEPLTWYDEAVGPVSEPKGELDADLYLALPDLSGLAPLPFRVSVSGHASDAEAVLSALLTAEEPGYPLIFPGSGSVIDLAVQGTVCTVDLSEGFFASLPEAARGLAVRSIAATLCALPDLAAVRFTVGGSAAVFDGEDWSGPWRESDLIEVY